MFKNILFGSFLLFIATSFLSAQMLYYKNPVIARVEFQGLINSKPDEIKDLIFLKRGSRFNEEALNRSVKILFGLDRFSDVKADVKETPNGLKLTFIVVENPYIRKMDFKFKKNRSKSRDDLEKAVLLSDSSFFNKGKAERSVKKIEALYNKDGFIEAKVSYRLVPVAKEKNVYDLIFDINEGHKVVVEKINISGNKNIKTGEIKGIMKTKEKAFIFQSGVLKDKDFNEDKERILMYYGQKGYIDAKVTRYEWKITKMGKNKHKAIQVYIGISEGEQYMTGSIEITNNTLFTTKTLRKLIDLKEGNVFNKTKIEMGRYKIYNKYSDNGHLYANVSVVYDKNVSNKIVNTKFVIYEGPRAHIESLNISGNTKTKTYVIRREMIFKEGELYIQRKVKQSMQRLRQLQYFKDVQITPAPGSAEGLINLDLKVEEQRTGLITFGVGYGTESGINGSAQVTEKNLFGTGRSIAFKGEYGQKRQLIQLSFQEPWLFNTPTYAGFSISYSHNLYDNIAVDDNHDGKIDTDKVNTNNFDYINNSTTALTGFKSDQRYFRNNFSIGFNIARRFFIFWNTYLSYTYNYYVDAGATFNNALVFSTTWQVNTNLNEEITKPGTSKHTVGIGTGYNSTDNPLTPTHGIKFNFDFNYVGGIFGGQIHYLRPKINFNAYINPVWKMVVAMHASTEMLLPQFGVTSIVNDYSDLLWFDGVYEMRGYQNNVVRGESKVFYSTELRFPIYQPSVNLWGLFFFDYGKVWSSYKDWTLNPDGYLFSFGVGIRLDIPMIPIRLYLARRGNVDSNGAWKLRADSTGSTKFFNNDWNVVFSIQGLF